jgi:hypothetical protein
MNTVLAIVLFLIILIALYKVYYTLNPELLSGDSSIIKLKRSPQLDIDISTLEDASGITYFYDGWLMVNEIQSENVDHIIFNRGRHFVVSLKSHVLSIVGLANEGDIDKTTGTHNGNLSYKIVDIATNFPFQTPVYFCINVDENLMDIYLNGKIVKSIKNTDVKNIPNNPSSPNPDFTTFVTGSAPTTVSVGSKYLKGHLIRFRREAGLTDPQSIWANFMMGPGASPSDETNSSEYHAKAVITRNNKPRRTINFF